MTRFFLLSDHCGLLIWGAPSDERTGYCLRFETRSLYLYPPGTGWPGYTPRHWVTVSVILGISLCSHSTEYTENTLLLLRNLTTGHREPSSHFCLLDYLHNCFLTTTCNIRYNNGLPIVAMQYWRKVFTKLLPRNALIKSVTTSNLPTRGDLIGSAVLYDEGKSRPCTHICFLSVVIVVQFAKRCPHVPSTNADFRIINCYLHCIHLQRSVIHETFMLNDMRNMKLPQ
jgi:hypothetical protein